MEKNLLDVIVNHKLWDSEEVKELKNSSQWNSNEMKLLRIMTYPIYIYICILS